MKRSFDLVTMDGSGISVAEKPGQLLWVGAKLFNFYFFQLTLFFKELFVPFEHMSEWYDGVNSLVVVETSEKQSFAPREASNDSHFVHNNNNNSSFCCFFFSLSLLPLSLPFVFDQVCLILHTPNRDHILNAHMRWVFLRVHGGVVCIVGFFSFRDLEHSFFHIS